MGPCRCVVSIWQSQKQRSRALEEDVGAGITGLKLLLHFGFEGVFFVLGYPVAARVKVYLSSSRRWKSRLGPSSGNR